jgi:hypothetical protein
MLKNSRNNYEECRVSARDFLNKMIIRKTVHYTVRRLKLYFFL